MQELVIGIVVTLIGALVVGMFNARQLYVVIPRFFGHGGLTSSGQLIEVRLYNRGRSMEEELTLSLPPKGVYELVGAEHPDLVLDNKAISLMRLGPRTETSMLILAEGISLSEFSPSLSSKATSGVLLKKIEDVPPNYGSVALVLCLIAAFMLGGYSWVERDLADFRASLNEEAKKRETEKLEKENQKREYMENFGYLDDLGWTGIENFVESKIHLSYPGFEFPVSISSSTKSNGYYSIGILVANKTASNMEVTAYFESEDVVIDSDLRDGAVSNFSVSIAPFSAKELFSKVKVDRAPLDKIYLKLALATNNSFVHGLRLHPAKNKEILISLSSRK